MNRKLHQLFQPSLQLYFVCLVVFALASALFSLPLAALELVDLEQFDDTNAVQNPAGYPAMPRLNPSTRFILPRMPRQVRG